MKNLIHFFYRILNIIEFVQLLLLLLINLNKFILDVPYILIFLMKIFIIVQIIFLV